MAWTCNWNIAAIDPLDHAYWDELYAALSERRIAAGLDHSALFRQPRRAPARCLVAPRRYDTWQEAWPALLAAVRELAPLFYWPDALEDNAGIRTSDDSPLLAGGPSPLRPIPVTVDKWLPALAEPCAAMPPRSDAGRMALKSVRDALDRMRLLRLVPSARGGVNTKTPGGLARVLVSNVRVYQDGTRAMPAAAGDIVAWQGTSTGWICECNEVENPYDTGPMEIFDAHPYLAEQVARFRAELVCYAPIGGTVRAHFVSDTITRAHVAWNGGKDAWSPGPFDPGYVHADLDYALGTLLGQESGPDGFSSVAGVSAGWNTLGTVAPNTVRIFLSGAAPATLPADVADGYDAVVAAHWPGALPAGHALYTHSRTSQTRSWRIDAAYIDLTSYLDKVSP